MINSCKWKKCKLYVPVSEINYIPITWQIFLQVTYKGCIETKEYSLAHGFLQTYNLATQIVMTLSLSVNTQFCVNVAVKRFKRSYGIK